MNSTNKSLLSITGNGLIEITPQETYNDERGD
jgi:hypothetical protein